MTETHSDMRPGIWQVPECPFLIEYSPALLDEIRLAGVDAFFSLPRGGAEIGGILFGKHNATGVRIEAFRPMECEHAMGPTFVLSDRDKAKLKAQLEQSAHDGLLQNMVVVGWYHTHTRSEIFLSDLDMEVYNQFFPEFWQIALVLRPAGMKPTRAGFFFRGPDGVVHTAASYREFVLSPLIDKFGGNGRPDAMSPMPVRRPVEAPVNPVVKPRPKPQAETLREPVPDRIQPTGVSDRAAQGPEAATLPSAAPILPARPAPPPSAAVIPPAAEVQAIVPRTGLSSAPLVEPGPDVDMQSAAEFVPPAFMIPPEKKPSRLSWWAAILFLLLGAGGYFGFNYFRHAWAAKHVDLHLQALDTNGQLRIQWDPEAAAAVAPTLATVEIVDGPSSSLFQLDNAKLRTGTLQYTRKTGVVEVHLTLTRQRGAPVEEFTSFYGQRPVETASPEKQDSNTAAQSARQSAELKKQELRALEAERALEKTRQTKRREEERKRIANQMPAGGSPVTAEKQPAAKSKASAHRAAPSPISAPAPSDDSAGQKAIVVVTPPPPQASATATLPPDRPPVITERQSPPPALPTASLPPPPRPAAPSQPPLSGRWVYSPASKTGSAFPPESVTLMLVQADNRIHGTFSGRYKVPKNARVSPRVNFSFEGPLSANSSKFTFTASDGMRGQIELIRLPGKQNAIEVVWYSERDKLTFDDIFFRAP